MSRIWYIWWRLISKCQSNTTCLTRQILHFSIWSWLKEPPPPGGVSYLLCSQTKNPEDEDPPRRICTGCFEGGPLPPSFWLGNGMSSKKVMAGHTWCLQVIHHNIPNLNASQTQRISNTAFLQKKVIAGHIWCLQVIHHNIPCLNASQTLPISNTACLQKKVISSHTWYLQVIRHNIPCFNASQTLDVSLANLALRAYECGMQTVAACCSELQQVAARVAAVCEYVFVACNWVTWLIYMCDKTSLTCVTWIVSTWHHSFHMCGIPHFI